MGRAGVRWRRDLDDGHLRRDLREGRQGLLRLRDDLDQPGWEADREGNLDQHRQGRLMATDFTPGDSVPELKVTPDKYLPHRYAGASGDFNPIHIDPEFARQVGLPGNILHGLWMMA